MMCRELNCGNSLALGVGFCITKVPLMVVESQIVCPNVRLSTSFGKSFLYAKLSPVTKTSKLWKCYQVFTGNRTSWHWHPGTHQWCCTISISRKAWLLSGAFLKCCVGKKIIIEDIKKICDSFTLLIGFMYKNS